MSKKALTLASVVLFASFSIAEAQTFTTGPLNLDGSNIITLGPVVYAFNLDGGANSTTLNGITLTGINSITTSSPDFSITGSPGYDGTLNKDGNASDPLVPGDPLYTLQENGAYYALTLTLDSLSPGQEYAVQLTIGEQPGDSRSQSYTDGTVTSPTVYAHSGPQYILDTFTATSSSEVLQASTGGGQGAQLTGFVLESVPEPASWTLMGLGLAGLVFLSASRRGYRIFSRSSR